MSQAASVPKAPASPVPASALWFGLLGGAVAWVFHFALMYGISEFGCAGHEHPVRLLGVPGTLWGLFAVTLLALLGASASAVTAFRSSRALEPAEGEPPDPTDPSRPDFHAARTGLVSSGTFIFIILVETIPAFFFLRGC